MTQDDAEMMLEASVGELRLLDHVVSDIIDASRGPVEYELAVTAGRSRGVWAALGRVVILTSYTAMERLLVTFAIERRIVTPHC
jgi:hypothetical protein